MKPECAPKSSDLTQSDKLGRMYEAQEMVEAATGDGQQALVDALNEAAGLVREVAEDYRESAQNIEDGFGHRTYQCDELDERADEVEAWADELENAAQEVEGMESEETETCSTCDGSGEQMLECEACEGEGLGVSESCTECGGEGEVGTTCDNCDGEGEVKNEDAEPDTEAMDDVATEAAGQMP